MSNPRHARRFGGDASIDTFIGTGVGATALATTSAMHPPRASTSGTHTMAMPLLLFATLTMASACQTHDPVAASENPSWSGDELESLEATPRSQPQVPASDDPPPTRRAPTARQNAPARGGSRSADAAARGAIVYDRIRPSGRGSGGRVERNGFVYETGALFEPPEGKVIHAMGQWREGNEAHTAVAGEGRSPVTGLQFIPIGPWMRPWENRITAFTDLLEGEVDAGRMLHIGINLAGIDDQGEGVPIDHLVAWDTVYDDRIRDLARVVGGTGAPTFIRIGFEFNGPWNGYHPYAYPQAYRRIVDIFDEVGALNAAFVWCYEPAAPDDFDATDSRGPLWFPGEDVVDWFGLDVFVQRDFQLTPGRSSPDSRAAHSERFLRMARDFGKPVIIAEASAVDVDITDSRADGVEDWNAWFAPFFAWVRSHPEIKAVHYVNVDWQTIGRARERGWLDADIGQNSYIAERFRNEISGPTWIHADDTEELLGWVEHSSPSRLDEVRALLPAPVNTGRGGRGGRR